MMEFLKYLLLFIVDDKDQLNVEERNIETDNYLYTINASREDIPKIIGKEGKIINSIRNLAKIIAVKKGIKIRVDIAEPV